LLVQIDSDFRILLKEMIFWAGTGAVDNARARRKGALGKYHETQISSQWVFAIF
jgi:hypothetical protein